MKCPLCDGTVANGRCTFCGMPWRNDAVLYHLNERPSEHYRHASPKARAVMRSQHNAAGASTIGKNASKADIKAHQEQIREDAVKRMSTTKAPTGSGSSDKKRRKFAPVSGSYDKRNDSCGASRKKVKTNRGFLFFFIFILIIWFVNTALPHIMDTVQNISSSYKDTDTYDGTDSYTGAENPSSDNNDDDTWFYKSDSGSITYYMLAAGKGTVTVGKDIEAGTYEVWTAESSVTLLIRNSSKTGKYSLSGNDDYLSLTLKDGDLLSLTDAENSDSHIYLDLVSKKET